MPICKSDQSISTGDPNFAAALMTVGCPPNDPPVRLIASDDGHDYLSFRIRERAIDGTLTMNLSAAWSDPDAHQAMAQSGHPFGRVMAFTAGKEKATGPSLDAWVSHMASWLGITIDAAFDIFDDAPRVCRANPESDAAYCAAFLANRFYLLDIARQYRDQGAIENLMNHDAGFSLISEKLAPKKRAYLLSKTR